MWIWSLGWEDPLEKGMATHSSILAWEICQAEEPGGLQSTGSQRVGHGWATSPCLEWNDMNGVVRIKGWLNWIQERMTGEHILWESNGKGMLLISGCLGSFTIWVSCCIQEWPSHIWEAIFHVLPCIKLKLPRSPHFYKMPPPNELVKE